MGDGTGPGQRRAPTKDARRIGVGRASLPPLIQDANSPGRSHIQGHGAGRGKKTLDGQLPKHRLSREPRAGDHTSFGSQPKAPMGPARPGGRTLTGCSITKLAAMARQACMHIPARHGTARTETSMYLYNNDLLGVRGRGGVSLAWQVPCVLLSGPGTATSSAKC